MVKEIKGFPSSSSSSNPPQLPFHCPHWFNMINEYPKRRRPGDICWNHKICEWVEYLCGCSLGAQEDEYLPLKSPEEKKKEWEERLMKMKAVLETIDKDSEVRRNVKRREPHRLDVERSLKRRKDELDEALAKFENCKKHKIIEWTIEEGEIYDVPSLLSSPSRDYLIKYNGDQVHISQLSGKHVLLYFSCLKHEVPKPHDPDSNVYVDMEEIYNVYHPKGMFEVVFIAIGDNQELFHDSFSHMPWIAIPHQDKEARSLFKTKFSIPELTFPTPVLFDPEGTVLLKDAAGAFRVYGAEGFPFTKQRRKDVSEETSVLWSMIVNENQKLPLTALLGDTLISSDGNAECTSKLEGKTVGLYFFETSELGFHQAKVLLNCWKMLKDTHCNKFEIVLINEGSVNHRFSLSIFKEKFGSIPWYSLPFDGRKLCQIFKLCGIRWDEDVINAGYFIVLQEDKYEPFSYFAYDILETFGVDSYPFTLESAVETVKIKQQKNIVLSKLLSPTAPLLRGASTDYKECTTVSHLSGKRILLLFATYMCFRAGSFFSRLEDMYYDKKGTTDEFEVVCISLDCDEKPSTFLWSVEAMPWLFHSFVPDFSVSLYEKIFHYPPHLPAVAAFGADGHLQTKVSNVFCKMGLDTDFPFVQGDMAEEVHKELVKTYKWDLKRLFSRVKC